MFLGHFAVGMGAKAADPRISLGTLFLAAQFLDLLWPSFLLLDIEHVTIAPGITEVTPLDFTYYPFSHSLLMVLVWGLLFGAVYRWARGRTGAAILLSILVVSHWILDLIVHRPDLPLYPNDSPLVGLGLWHSMPGTLAVEGFLFISGVILYLRATRTRNRSGKYGFWALVAFLVVIFLSNLFGPPPPDVAAIAWVGQLQWILIIWGYWVDRHRTAR